jgi:hypothetical protein
VPTGFTTEMIILDTLDFPLTFMTNSQFITACTRLFSNGRSGVGII